MTPDPLVRVSGLRKAFGTRRVLDGVTLEVGAGEAVALLGANGAGKTTLLKLLATLARPTRGTALIGGHDCARRPEAVRRLIGLVAHGAHVYEDLTARENLRFWATLGGLRVPPAGLAAALADVELERHADERVRTFSEGMRRRLSLARFVLARPRVLLLDEPFAGMNQAEADRCMALIHKTRGRGVTVLLVDHHMDTLMKHCHRLVVMHHGEKLAEGVPDVIRRDPKVIETYLGGRLDA